MTTVIPCPNCGKRLKIRDRAMLGKKAKCSGCEHRFVLEIPPDRDEDLVAFELAGAEPEDQVGRSARWVPDDAPAESRSRTATVEAPPAVQVREADPEPASFESDAGGVARLKEIRRRNAKRRNVGIAIGALTALAVAGVWNAIEDYKADLAAEKAAAERREAERNKPTINRAWERDKEALRTNLEMANRFDPMAGQPDDPIELLYVPDGTSILFHLRPAEIWREESRGQEVVHCLGPLGEWAQSKLKEHALTEPANVEEALFCIILGARGSEPQVASVVTYRQPVKKSELVANLFEERVRDLPEIWTGGERAYLIRQEENSSDVLTLASCPNDPILIDEMAATTGQPANATGFVQDLLNRSHRGRHFTLVFRPDDLLVHGEALFDDLLRPAATQIARWFGEDVDAVAWSVHLGDRLYSEIGMRPRATSATDRVVSAERLQITFRERLDQLPRLMYDLIARYMQPKTVGERQLIGRFPAMLKAVAVTTLGGTAEDYVQLTTVIDNDHAAPNLALGGLLTWYESTRTDFTKEVEQPTAQPELPERLADRLKKPVEIDFRRTPLQEALDFIAEETKVPIDVDGDALKLAGYTKNMPQNHQLGTVPAAKGLAAILAQYDKMCIVLDEPKKQATVTTYAAAKQKGLKPHEFE